MQDLVKACVIFAGYLLLAPALGLVLARDRRLERAVLALLVWMPSWFPGKLTLMLHSVERYRGHTKGFEASLIEIVAVALIISAAQRRDRAGRSLPPGLWIYLAWCGLSCLSLVTAANPTYALMAAVKFTKASLIFVGAFRALRDEEDLRWLLHALAFSLMLQALVGLKLRFLEGRWQVACWFEHQNPMAMWAYLTALPLLSVALAPQTKNRDTWVYLGGVGAAGLLILLSVSRAALAAFVAGAGMVVVLAACRGFSWKLARFCAIGAVAGTLVGLLALDSVMSRFTEAASREEDQDLRAILNAQSRAMLADHPLGIGWNNFGVANSLPVERYAMILMDWDQSRGFRIYDENYFANPLTESLYWLLLAENGYPGFVSFVVFLLATVGWAVRGMIVYWRTPMGYFVAGLLVALAITYLHGTVERVLTQTKNLSMWLMFAGFLARVQFNRVHRLAFAPSLVGAPAQPPSRQPASHPVPALATSAV
jgi:hypothetical protein